MRLNRIGFLSGLSIVLFFATQAFAQGNPIPAELPAPPIKPEYASPWRVGVQIGANANSYSNTPDVGSSMRVGFIAGAQADYRLGQVFSLQPELRATQKGFSYNTSNGINFDVRVTYFEIPLLVKAKFLAGQKVQPYVITGPNLGINVGTDVVETQNGNPVNGPPLNVLFQTLDFAWDEGVGLEYHFAQKMSGFVEVRGSIGLVNVSELVGTDWKSRGIQITVGGFFDL